MWWGSFKVAAGYAIDTYGDCQDHFDYGSLAPREVGVTSAAGCVSPTYDFNHVSIFQHPQPLAHLPRRHPTLRRRLRHRRSSTRSLPFGLSITICVGGWLRRRIWLGPRVSVHICEAAT